MKDNNLNTYSSDNTNKLTNKRTYSINNKNSQNLKKNKIEDNFFLTENLFQKNVLNLKYSRNDKIQETKTINFKANLPNLYHKHSISTDTNKRSVFNNLLKLHEKLEEVNENHDEILQITRGNIQIELNISNGKIQNKLKSKGFFNFFNSQLKVNKIRNDDEVRFKNISIERAVNKENKKINEELMDLRQNNYDFTDYLKQNEILNKKIIFKKKVNYFFN